MKKILLFLGVIYSQNHLPVGTSLDYKVSFSGINAASGKLTIFKNDTIGNIQAYHLQLAIRTIGITDKFYSINDKIDIWLENNDYKTLKEALEEVEEGDLHHKIYNEDYFIIGYYQAEQWLIDEGRNFTFEVLGFCLEQEKEMFGEIQTVFDNAETLVNHYAYWLGYEVVQNYIDKLKQ